MTKIKEEKRYEFDINIKFTQIEYAINEKKAKESVINSFKEEYNLDLTDEEIVSIRES